MHILKLNFIRIAGRLTAALPLALFWGCGHLVDTMPSRDNGNGLDERPLPSSEGDRLVFGENPDMSWETSASKADEIRGGKDKVSKADAYWKMRTIIDGLQKPMIASDLVTGTEDVRKQVEGGEADGPKEGLKMVIGDIDAAWKAVKTETEFKQYGLDSASIPWGAGRYSVELRLDDLYSKDKRFTGSSMDFDKFKQRVLSYAEQFHMPPSDLRRQALQRASDKLEMVADEMDRQRARDNDHLIGREQNPAPGYRPFTSAETFKLPELPGGRTQIKLP